MDLCLILLRNNVSRRYPPKIGECSITGCKRTPTEWHHIISQAQIITRGLPESMFTDPGNLQELCRFHHDMTTASLSRKILTKKNGPYKAKPRLTYQQRKDMKEKRKREIEREKQDYFDNVISPSLEKMYLRGVSFPDKFSNISQHSKDKQWRRMMEDPSCRFSFQFQEMTIENAYPPDHWLHNPEEYDEDFSIEFENGGNIVWTNGGWFTSKSRKWDIPPYRTYYMS